jgi:hypothetical protein
MGALTHSRLDRAVVARYFSFLIVSQLIIFTLIGVIFSKSICNATVVRAMSSITSSDSVHQIVILIGKRASFAEIIKNLNRAYRLYFNFETWVNSFSSPELPDVINRTYINQSSYWLTFFPYVHEDLESLYIHFSLEFRLRGLLVVFDLAQIINLIWISFKTQCVLLSFCLDSNHKFRHQCIWTHTSRHS